MLVSQCSLYRDRTLTKVKTCLIFSHIPLDPWVYFYQKVSNKLNKKGKSNWHALYRLEQDHLTWLALIYLLVSKKLMFTMFLSQASRRILIFTKNLKNSIGRDSRIFCTGETTDVLNYGLGLANEVEFFNIWSHSNWIKASNWKEIRFSFKTKQFFSYKCRCSCDFEIYFSYANFGFYRLRCTKKRTTINFNTGPFTLSQGITLPIVLIIVANWIFATHFSYFPGFCLKEPTPNQVFIAHQTNPASIDNMTDIANFKQSTISKPSITVQTFYNEYKWVINSLLVLIGFRILSSTDQISTLSYKFKSVLLFIKGLLANSQQQTSTRIFEDLRFEYDMDFDKMPMAFVGVGMLIFVILLSWTRTLRSKKRHDAAIMIDYFNSQTHHRNPTSHKTNFIRILKPNEHIFTDLLKRLHD